MSSVVQNMLKEEPEVNLTPMIDVVFLLLIFFMLQKFRTYENKLPFEMPLNFGRFIPPLVADKQVSFKLKLLSGSKNKVEIYPNVSQEPFHSIAFKPSKNGKEQMFAEVRKMLMDSWESSKLDIIYIEPEAKVPFDYVALLFKTIIEVKESKEKALNIELKRALKENDRDLIDYLHSLEVEVKFKVNNN